MANKWRQQTFGIKALVNESGEILATVHSGHQCYHYETRRFIDCESAMQAAERDHGGVEGIDLRNTIASLAARA